MGIAHNLAETARSIWFLAVVEQDQLIEQEDGTWHFYPRGKHREGILLTDAAHRQRVTDQVMAWGVVGLAILLSFFIWRTWFHLFALTALGACVGYAGAFRAYVGETKVPALMSGAAFRHSRRIEHVRYASYARLIFAAIVTPVFGVVSIYFLLFTELEPNARIACMIGSLLVFGFPYAIYLILLKRKVAAMDLVALVEMDGPDES